MVGILVSSILCSCRLLTHKGLTQKEFFSGGLHFDPCFYKKNGNQAAKKIVCFDGAEPSVRLPSVFFFCIIFSEKERGVPRERMDGSKG